MTAPVEDPPAGSAVRLPTGMTLAIGSMPHRDPERAVDLILGACPEAPCWPQLPARGFQENMWTQFSEGVPCLRPEPERQKIFFASPGGALDELTAFYERCMRYEETGDLPEAFALSPAFAAGLYRFRERLAHRQPPVDFVKGQITGPLTFGLSILDENGLPALFHETLSDVARKALQMKALWQMGFLRPLGTHGILFVDEPILAGFGSAAFINLSRAQAVSTLQEIFSAVRAAGFLVGSHCCANTDWSLMVDAGVDIINFDAYAYTGSIGLYAPSVSSFLRRGGTLAWGLVPSVHQDRRPDVDQLYRMLQEGIEGLVQNGLPESELRKQLVLTPSCGLGTLTEAEAEAALRELRELGEAVQARMR